MPDIEEHFSELAEANLFATLNLTHEFLQVPLKEEVRVETALITPDDTGEFTRMSFGLTNAPFYFCQLMKRVLGHLGHRVAIFILDDVFLFARTWKQLLY